MKQNYLSASVICMDFLNLQRDIKALEKAKVDYLHFDVMDGVFVPRYGLFPEMLASITSMTDLPVDVHMMVKNPEPYIEDFAKARAKRFCVHAEGNDHLHRTLSKIRQSGMQAGVALNIATPLSYLDYITTEVDYVMLMAINPGIIGHKVIPGVFNKIQDLEKKLNGKGIPIMVDGGVNFETSPQMVRAGADILVGGSSIIFRPKEGSIEEMVLKYRLNMESRS